MSTPDLGTIDELCRLATTVRGLGCRAHLVGADEHLWSLLDLAGVADVLCACPAERPSTAVTTAVTASPPPAATDLTGADLR
jgi:hypothetical protein